MKADLVIIGGGPAGMSAAVAAYESGIRDIVIIERDSKLGGILQQCIHNGFGLHRFKEELTGPEYAERYSDEVERLGIPYITETMVVDVTEDRVVTAVNKKDGYFTIKAKAIILAMGCRERPRGALNIPGYRPAGVYSAGTVHQPEFYKAMANLMKNDELPVALWVYLGIGKSEGGNDGYTYGLENFGKTEIEIIGSDKSLEEIREFLYFVCLHILKADMNFYHGETLRFTSDEEYTITKSEAVYVDGETFKISY